MDTCNSDCIGIVLGYAAIGTPAVGVRLEERTFPMDNNARATPLTFVDRPLCSQSRLVACSEMAVLPRRCDYAGGTSASRTSLRYIDKRF